MSYTLGIDIGTFESKGVLLDGDGQVIAQAARPHEMLVPQPGWAEHNPTEDWWGDFVHITQRILADSRINPESIKGIGCSAIGPCMLPVDRAGDALMNGVLYGVDNRAANEVDELTDRIGLDQLMSTCGNALTSQSVGPKILWLKRHHQEVFEETDKIHTSTTFIVAKLTGRTVIDHYTAANFSPLYDIHTQDWTSDLTDEIVDRESLPELLWSSEIAGVVSDKAAKETGLVAGTPVLTGTIDAAAEAISVGVMGPNQMMMMYGSTIFIIMPTSGRIADPRLWYAPWLFEGQHACMAGLATSGTLTHWFRDQFARDLDREIAFAALAKEAADSPPGANGVMVHPYFSGERTPIHDPFAKGSIAGLDLTHTRGDVYRALLEGIALGTGHVIDTYCEANARPDSLHAVGGGVQNRVWSQATSDVTGMNQIVREKSVGASYGNAFLTAIALGSARPEDIDRWNPVVATIEPRKAYSSLYQRRLTLFKDYYLNTREIVRRLN